PSCIYAKYVFLLVLGIFVSIRDHRVVSATSKMTNMDDFSGGLPALSNRRYQFGVGEYRDLCDLRDELSLLSAYAAKCATHQQDVPYHNVLARFFESVADRLGGVLDATSEVAIDSIHVLDATGPVRRH
ncbi:MAG TPA: hypothetical protein VL997_02110, partial [Dyella sp.]|nr:hypothetical protein [Dyella sp.]